MSTLPNNAVNVVRQAMGWTQNQLAYRLGVTSESICRWERSDTLPKNAFARQRLEEMHTNIHSPEGHAANLSILPPNFL